MSKQGRQRVPGGYVAITEHGKATIRYTLDDYRRVVRMGAPATELAADADPERRAFYPQSYRETASALAQSGWHGKP